MKTLPCTCRNCGTSMQIEIEESGFFSDSMLVEMAMCDRCFDALERIEKIRNQKANLGEDRPQRAKFTPSKGPRPYNAEKLWVDTYNKNNPIKKPYKD